MNETSEKVLTLDPHASVTELMSLTRAVVGIDYCFVLLNNMVKMSRMGWRQLASAPYVTVAGRECVMMWKGHPQPGASMGASVPEFFFDEELHGIAYPFESDPVAPQGPADPAPPVEPIGTVFKVSPEEPAAQPTPAKPGRFTAEPDPELSDDLPAPVRAVPPPPRRK